jgi:hypothetical protein
LYQKLIGINIQVSEKTDNPSPNRPVRNYPNS